MPFTWSGGGGPVGNRYFLGTYGVFLFLVPPLQTAVAGLLTTGDQRAVRGADRSRIRSSRSRNPAEHSKTGLFRWLPTELTMVNDLPINVTPDRASGSRWAARRRCWRISSTTTSTTARATRSGCKGESSADILLRAPIRAGGGRRRRRGVALAAHRQADRDSRDRAEAESRRDRHRRRSARHRHGAELAADHRAGDAARHAVQVRSALSDQLRLHASRISSSTGFVPMFENGAQRQPLPRRDGPADSDLRSSRVVATIAVVTSSPPFAEGGHLVMARELVRALREEGPRHRPRRHAAESVRPAGQRLSGGVVHRRSARARGAQGRSGDQPAVSRLRGAASESRAVAQPPHARVLRSVGSVQLAPVVEGQASRNARAAR